MVLMMLMPPGIVGALMTCMHVPFLANISAVVITRLMCLAMIRKRSEILFTSIYKYFFLLSSA